MNVSLNKWHIIKTLRNHSCNNLIRLSYEPTENNYNPNISNSNLGILQRNLCVSLWLLVLCKLQKERGLVHSTNTISKNYTDKIKVDRPCHSSTPPKWIYFSQFNYPDRYLKAKPYPSPCFYQSPSLIAVDRTRSTSILHVSSHLHFLLPGPSAQFPCKEP